MTTLPLFFTASLRLVILQSLPGACTRMQCFARASWRLHCALLHGRAGHFRPGSFCTSAAAGRGATPSGHNTEIQVYNSLSRKKEALILHSAAAATWYSCGPTVYDHAHLGHACSYVRFDIIRRIMTQFFGINVVMVMVITDVDDKIIKRSKEKSQTARRW